MFAHSNPSLHPPPAALRDSPHRRRFGNFARPQRDSDVCDLTKDGVRYEIANFQSSDSTAVPKPFRNMKKYTNTVTVSGILVSHESYRNRVECEFTDATGYYKIICHSGNLNDLYAILGALLQYNFEKWEAEP